MNQDKAVSSNLDNTTIHKSKDNFSENCNTGAYPVESLKTSVNQVFSPEDGDAEDFDADVMTGSYGEISLDQELLGIKNDGRLENKNSPSSKETEDEKPPSPENTEGNCSKEKRRPNSLILTKNSKGSAESESKLSGFVENAEPWKRIHKSQQTSDSQTTSIDGSPSLSSEEFAIYSPGHRRTGSDTSGLSDLQGTITVDGDMVSFFAEDLQEKIKLSSPVSRWTDSSSYPASRSSTPSLHRQLLQSQVPLIDPSAVTDLEAHARKLASCVDTMLENLSGTLQSISSLTVDYMETYESAVCKTCDAVDNSIKTMYQLVAKCEELSNSVKPLYKIAQDIKSIKKSLDHFENVVERKS